MLNQKIKQKEDIVKQLGPLKEVHIKIKVPDALIDYINEIEVERDKQVKDLSQYCSEQVMRMMMAELDHESEDTVLKNYTIPRALQTFYLNDIMEKYCEWDMTNEGVTH